MQCMYLLCSDVWEEDKLFMALGLLMKNPTGFSRLQFLEKFMNVEWNFCWKKQKVPPIFLTCFIPIIINIMILLYFLKSVLLRFPWKCGLLYSAVDKTNIVLVEERLISKLQRVQTVTIFAGLLFSNAGIQTMLLLS